MNESISQSRTYVAVCNKGSFDGYYFKKFTLSEDVENTSKFAAWYFLNKLDFFACIDGVITFEDYQNIREV